MITGGKKLIKHTHNKRIENMLYDKYSVTKYTFYVFIKYVINNKFCIEIIRQKTGR